MGSGHSSTLILTLMNCDLIELFIALSIQFCNFCRTDSDTLDLKFEKYRTSSRPITSTVNSSSIRFVFINEAMNEKIGLGVTFNSYR